MQLPKEPVRGETITAVWAAQVVRYLRSLTPRPSPHVRPQRGASGTSYSLTAPAPGARSGGAVPLNVFNASVESEEGVKRIGIRYGTVNVNGEGSLWVPDGLVAETPDAYNFPVTGNGIVVLIGTVNSSGIVDSMTLGTEEVTEPPSGIPTVESTPTVAKLALGTFATVDGTFTVTSQKAGNQNFLTNGGFHYWWKA